MWLPGVGFVGALLDQKRQVVLHRKTVTYLAVTWYDTGPDYGPIMAFSGTEEAVQISNLVRPVKVANTEMKDAGG